MSRQPKSESKKEPRNAPTQARGDDREVSWNAAVGEYHAWQAMAEEALRSGVHPAIAYAIGRTGKVMPENVELTPDGTHAIASGEDADWLEAFSEYAEKHPETVEGEFLRGAVPGKDRLH